MPQPLILVVIDAFLVVSRYAQNTEFKLNTIKSWQMGTTQNTPDQASTQVSYPISEQEARFLLIRDKLMEQSGTRLDDLDALLKACIEGAQENFDAWSGRVEDADKGDINMDDVKSCFSKIREASREVRRHKDRLIAGHKKLISVAIEGKERYRTWGPNIEMPTELKEKRWQIKPEQCAWDSQFIQLQMADLEQMYIAVILNGALQIKLMSSKLAIDILQKPPKSGQSNYKIAFGLMVREMMRWVRWIAENVQEWMTNPPSFKELLNLPMSPSSS